MKSNIQWIVKWIFLVWYTQAYDEKKMRVAERERGSWRWLSYRAECKILNKIVKLDKLCCSMKTSPFWMLEKGYSVHGWFMTFVSVGDERRRRRFGTDPERAFHLEHGMSNTRLAALLRVRWCLFAGFLINFFPIAVKWRTFDPKKNAASAKSPNAWLKNNLIRTSFECTFVRLMSPRCEWNKIVMGRKRNIRAGTRVYKIKTPSRERGIQATSHKTNTYEMRIEVFCWYSMHKHTLTLNRSGVTFTRCVVYSYEFHLSSFILRQIKFAVFVVRYLRFQKIVIGIQRKIHFIGSRWRFLQ